MVKREYQTRGGGLDLYFTEIDKFPVLDKTQERNLVSQAVVEREARELLIGCCLRYCKPKIIALQYKFGFLDVLGIVNDKLMAITNNLEKYKGESRFSTYVYRSIINAVKDVLRKEKRHKSLDEISLGGIPAKKEALQTEVGEEKTKREKLLEKLEEGLSNLPSEESELIRRNFFEGKSIRKIGQYNSALRQKLQRTRKKTLKKLQKFMEAA